MALTDYEIGYSGPNVVFNGRMFTVTAMDPATAVELLREWMQIGNHGNYNLGRNHIDILSESGQNNKPPEANDNLLQGPAG